MKLALVKPRKDHNKAFLKVKSPRPEIDKFKANLIKLSETKEGSKKLIGRKTEIERNTGSLFEYTITILDYEK